jgi:L-aminopeptidase/D-esterase-like protein
VIGGLRIGHFTDEDRRTGCTVILPPAGSTASCEVRGLAPGTRETALLAPEATVDRVDAILLTGGSAFGLAAADGVVAGLAEQGIGFETPAGPVPIVPAAVFFDRAVGEPAAPGPEEGRRALQAALAATTGSWPRRGACGAGTGATVGGLAGSPVPGGLGAAALDLPGGARIAAVAVVNALGDVTGADGEILAGSGTTAAILSGSIGAQAPLGQATTLVCVVTDADVDKLACFRLARAAHAGVARATSPAATAFDGDVAFAVATRAVPAPAQLLLETASAEVTALAIRDAVAPR